MAKDNSIISVLNIGAQRVGMARFKTKNGKLQLKQYESTEILADPAAANSRNAQIKMAVLEIAQKLKVKNRISYAVSGQSVFTRFFTLPDLDGVDKGELVSAEAQQHIPFALDEVKWDWQEITETDGESEVVIAAVKSKVLNELQDAVEGAGMYTTEVDPSPAALFNAFKYNYPDMTEPAMLIDIGAKTSNVIYIDGDRFFCRSIAFGGATVTTAIAKEYNVPFLEAEKQKLKNGIVALDTRHTSEMEEIIAALASCIRSSLNRMPSEIGRTTNFYRSQQNGNAPKHVFLAGGGANLPKLTTFLKEKLRLPVEFFNPLRAVSLDKSLDLEELSPYTHLMGELVGLAVRRIDKGKLNLELVPDSVAKEKSLDKRKTKLAVGVSLLVVGLFIYMVSLFLSNSTLKSLEDELASELALLTPEEMKMKSVIAAQQNALNDVAQLTQLQEDRTRWVDVINDLKSVYASKKFWFTEIIPLVNYTPDLNIEDATPLIPKKVMSANSKDEEKIVSTSNDLLVNAVMLRGIWLDEDHNITITTNNLLGEEIKKDQLNKYKSDREQFLAYGESKYFSRMLQYYKAGSNPKTATTEYASFGGDQMYKIKPKWDEDSLGSDFTIILPLKNPLILNKSK